MNWPGNDPFYNHNPGDNNSRRSAYGVNYVPWSEVDGKFGDVAYSQYTTRYNQRKNEPTSVTVELDGTYDAGTGQIDVTATATTDDYLVDGSQYRIYIALTESDIYYNGQYGDDWHHHTLRDMFPTGNGFVVNFNGSLPQSASSSASFTLNGQYAPENCRIVAWLQCTYGQKEVLNSVWSFLDDLGDMTGVHESPVAFRMGNAFPNPFNPKTTIPVSVEKDGPVLLEILSVDGRLVQVLHEGILDKGTHDFIWNGYDEAGRRAPSGVYMARVTGASG
ncbi:MAG: Omp28-related outer membrane protein, partial [Candidatus Krumholzibacteria bacterium]|nr:Omp28-related outer membrane protein [Candidatus Krumholzibacteria bacterium]